MRFLELGAISVESGQKTRPVRPPAPRKAPPDANSSLWLAPRSCQHRPPPGFGPASQTYVVRPESLGLRGLTAERLSDGGEAVSLRATTPTAPSLADKEPGLHEDLGVVRDRGLRLAQWPLEVTRTNFGLRRHQRQQPQPDRVAESGEDPPELAASSSSMGVSTSEGQHRSSMTFASVSLSMRLVMSQYLHIDSDLCKGYADIDTCR